MPGSYTPKRPSQLSQARGRMNRMNDPRNTGVWILSVHKREDMGIGIGKEDWNKGEEGGKGHQGSSHI